MGNQQTEDNITGYACTTFVLPRFIEFSLPIYDEVVPPEAYAQDLKALEESLGKEALRDIIEDESGMCLDRLRENLNFDEVLVRTHLFREND